jgi:hypothetical protein
MKSAVSRVRVKGVPVETEEGATTLVMMALAGRAKARRGRTEAENCISRIGS